MPGIQGIIKGYSSRFVPKPNSDPKEIEEIPNNSGKVLKIDGKNIAVYKTSDGTVLKKSAICKHLGCIVDWNDKDKTWDCPCHGSRYQKTGEVLNGPTKAPLDNI